MLEKNRETVRLAYKHFPLASHAMAQKAALASLAAGRQGKFWEYHDLLYKGGPQITEERLANAAKELGLDLEKFKAAQTDPALVAQVAKDQKDGLDLGVRGVPAVYVNGRVLKNRSVEGIQEMVDAALRKAGTKKP